VHSSAQNSMTPGRKPGGAYLWDRAARGRIKYGY
jgi:hypothetical protein